MAFRANAAVLPVPVPDTTDTLAFGLVIPWNSASWSSLGRNPDTSTAKRSGSAW
jgi:hypothetical protein